jgi:hypothetical protein
LKNKKFFFACLVGSLQFTNVAMAAEPRSVEVLTEVQASNQYANRSAPLNDSFAVLDRLLPTPADRDLFFNDWFAALSDFARETSDLHRRHIKMPDSELFAAGITGSQDRDGSFAKWVLTTDKGLFALIRAGGIFNVPIFYATARLNDAEWLQFKAGFEKALDQGQTELRRSQEYLKARTLALKALNQNPFKPKAEAQQNLKSMAEALQKTPSEEFNVSFLANLSAKLLINTQLTNDWGFRQRPSLEALRAMQLRKMDLIEILFRGPYLTQDQKNQTADGLIDFFKVAADPRADSSFAKAKSELFDFEPFQSRLRTLGTFLTKGSNPDYGYDEEYARIVGGSPVRSCRKIF